MNFFSRILAKKAKTLRKLLDKIPKLEMNGRCDVCRTIFHSVWLDCVKFVDVNESGKRCPTTQGCPGTFIPVPIKTGQIECLLQ